MTNEDKIKAVLILLEEYRDTKVFIHKDDFDSEDAWRKGIEEGKIDLAQDILSILNT